MTIGNGQGDLIRELTGKRDFVFGPAVRSIGMFQAHRSQRLVAATDDGVEAGGAKAAIPHAVTPSQKETSAKSVPKRSVCSAGLAAADERSNAISWFADTIGS